jgi:hypothetical protein
MIPTADGDVNNNPLRRFIGPRQCRGPMNRRLWSPHRRFRDRSSAPGGEPAVGYTARMTERPAGGDSDPPGRVPVVLFTALVGVLVAIVAIAWLLSRLPR